MHSQDEVSRRNAVLMSTGRIFNIAMSKLPNHKHGQSLSSTVAEFVDIMEKEARKQSALFDALGRRMDSDRFEGMDRQYRWLVGGVAL